MITESSTPLSNNNSGLARTEIYLLTGAFILLIINIFLQSGPPVYDEILFLPNVHLFEKYGLSEYFLLHYTKQAPGPLYQVIHHLFKPITHEQYPAMRFVNLFLLAGIIFMMIKAIRQYNKNSSVYLLPLLLLALPMTYKITGLALTEIPSMFFIAVFIWLEVRIQKDEKLWRFLILSFISGIMLGIAIMGRAPFLLCVAAVPFLAGWKKLFSVKNIFHSILVTVGAAIICLPVFFLWKGIIPPDTQYAQEGFSITNGTLGIAYLGFIFVFVAPGIFFYEKKIFLILGLLFILLAFTVSPLEINYTPMSNIVEKILPHRLFSFYGSVVKSAFYCIALYFLLCLGRLTMKKINEPDFIFALIGMLVIVLTCFKVNHLFNSRYVIQCAPFIALMLPHIYRRYKFNIALYLVGIVIGLVSMNLYFVTHT